MKTKRWPFAIILLLATAGCAASAGNGNEANAVALGRMMAGQSQMQGTQFKRAVTEAGQHPLGTKENPVRAAMPPGQRAYLDRLRCPDGAPPRYERRGSGGPSPYGNIVDFYEVACSGTAAVTIVMDMYHAGYVEDQSVPGFTIAPR